jgi:hypothetical protein
MLYHGASHPHIKGLRWCEHPQAVSGGFWLWDKIKEGANAVYDNVLKPVASVARKVVAPVGNFIGAEFGVPIAGTLADKGLSMLGLGRRRRGHKSLHPHGMKHPKHKGISWCHHPQALHGGFWLWDKIKEGANWVGDKVNQGVNWVGEHAGELARKAIEPVGNFIGKEFGIDNAGTMANQGLSMVGLGRRRRGGAMCGSGELTITHSGSGYGQVRRGGASTGGFKLFGHELPDTPALKRAKEEHKARLASMTPEQRADMKLINRGGARSARGAVVSQVMRERGCSLPEASRIVKAEGLY